MLKIIYQNGDQNMTLKQAKLLLLVFQMYQIGIKKFPNNINLRMNYSFFLAEQVNQKQQALQQLIIADQNPPFEVQYSIYRLKKLIENQIIQERLEKGKQFLQDLDIISEEHYAHAFNELSNQIEQSALSHMEFWNQLLEDTPDMQKLYDIGKRLNLQYLQVEICWSRLVGICSNRSKPYILFSKYLLEIRHDTDRVQDMQSQITQI